MFLFAGYFIYYFFWGTLFLRKHLLCFYLQVLDEAVEDELAKLNSSSVSIVEGESGANPVVVGAESDAPPSSETKENSDQKPLIVGEE